MSSQKGTASTRLLSMKFMQRATAADSSKSVPSTPNGPPAKRIRLSNGTSTPVTPELSDQQRLKKAQAEEELQRSVVMERLAAEAGETRWVLNVKEPNVQTLPLAIVQAGFADLDATGNDEQDGLADEEEEPQTGRLVAGRMVFGQMKQVGPNPSAKHDPESESGSSESEEDKLDDLEHEQDATYRPHREAFAARKYARMRPNRQEQERLAALRRKKEINLNSPFPDKEVNLSKLRSISGGSAAKGKGNSSHRSPASHKH